MSNVDGQTQFSSLVSRSKQISESFASTWEGSILVQYIGVVQKLLPEKLSRRHFCSQSNGDLNWDIAISRNILYDCRKLGVH